jgi:hypothetical protein
MRILTGPLEFKPLRQFSCACGELRPAALTLRSREGDGAGFFICGNCAAGPDAPRGACAGCGAADAPIERHHIDGRAVSDRTEPLCSPGKARHSERCGDVRLTRPQ